MNNLNPIELVKFVESLAQEESKQLNMLALLADAPPDDFTMKVKLPVQNELPAYRLGDNGLGAELAALDYGIAAPVPGQQQPSYEKSIGDLLTGELNETL